MSETRKTKYGYYELVNKPTQPELNAYYEKTYYQKEKSSYSHDYPPEERRYIQNRLKQKELVIQAFYREHGLDTLTNLSLLDIGCGEGFCLNYFSSRGLKVQGIDYSSYGCRTHNPEQLSNVMTGDTTKVIDQLISQSLTFDIIVMDNILEHMLQPEQLLQQVMKIMNKSSLLIVEVPNDFSELQQYLLDSRKIETEFWVVTPDHISYFNHKGLARLCESAGFKKYEMYSDYPIDLNLLTDSLNYVNNPDCGKGAHNQRIVVENYLHEKSTEKLLELYKLLADMGIGRSIVGYFSKGVDLIEDSSHYSS